MRVPREALGQFQLGDQAACAAFVDAPELDELRPQLRGARRKAVASLHRYFTTHAHRMNYPAFREAGIPVGSGAVESSHRRVLQARMKLAGQHWSHQGAHRMAQLRAAYKTAGPEHFAEVAVALAA